MREDVPTRPANHSPPPGAVHDAVWLVSYADDDDREMKADEIFRAIRRGEIDGETIVWREGMAEWQSIADTSELQSQLEALAGRGPAAERKRTVMGGFGPGSPAGRPITGPPRPAAPTAGAVGRNTLIGTGQFGLGRERANTAAERVHDEDDDLDSNLLESVRPPVGDAEPIHIPSQTTTARLPEVMGRGGFVFNEDDAPISLNPDSIETLPSNALESVVAPFPPAEVPSAPRGIFDIESDAPPKAPAAHAAIVDAPLKAHSPPPAPPMRSRLPDEHSEVRGPSIDPGGEFGEQKKSNAGKLGLLLLLFVGLGVAMFYLGRQSAGTAQTTVQPEPAQDPLVNRGGEATATAAATTESAGSEAPPPEAPADESPEPSATQATSEAAPAASDPAPSAEKPVSAPATPRRSPTSKPVTSPAPKPVVSPTPPAEEPAPSAAGPFDPAAASAALDRAAASASSCRQAGDPSGVANVTVTFAPSGRATNARISGPPFAGTTTGGCIAAKMRSAKVPAFSGDRMTVKKVVVIR